VSRPSPDREQLLDFARRFARELHGVEPPEAELAERIEYVMWGRKQAWTCLEDGLITEEELRNLLLDHLDYECAHVSGRSWPDFDLVARRRVRKALDEVLFGRDATAMASETNER
jgi:hypothetical protein